MLAGWLPQRALIASAASGQLLPSAVMMKRAAWPEFSGHEKHENARKGNHPLTVSFSCLFVFFVAILQNSNSRGVLIANTWPCEP
jgi:hypothetical protein